MFCGEIVSTWRQVGPQIVSYNCSRLLGLPTYLQVEEEPHVHDWAMRGGHIHQIQHTHLGAATADDFV